MGGRWILVLCTNRLPIGCFIIIISARCCPLLNIGILNWFPAWPVRSHLHPTTSRNLYEVVGPSGRWPSHAALSHTWSPLQFLFAPSAVRSLHYVACPLPLQLTNLRTLISWNFSVVVSVVSSGLVLVTVNLHHLTAGGRPLSIISNYFDPEPI